MNPVSLVTIHHEGAGTPSDVPRGAPEGYTYWIGASRWEHLRDVWESFATFHYNHVSLDICLSGNRMSSRVTDPDIRLIHGAFLDARRRGYVVAAPEVRAHRNSPGSSTVCPGDNTIARWGDVIHACSDLPPAPRPPKPQPWKVKPMYQPALVVAAVLQESEDGPALAGVAPDGSVFVWDADLGYHGGANGKPYFAGKEAAQLVFPNAAEKAASKKYVIVATDDPKHRYAFPES